LDPSDVVDLLSALVDRSLLVAETASKGITRYRLLETLRQFGEQALATTPTGTATMRDRHLAHFLARAEHWYVQQATAQEPQANHAFALDWDNLRAAFDWALATGRGRDVADVLYTTYAYAMHTGRWEHRDWAVAARAAGADTGRIASAAVVRWCSPAQADVPADALAVLDPAQPDLLARDIEQIWLARAAAAFHTTDLDEVGRATAWLRGQEPGGSDSITEAWTLANLIDATLSAPDPALVARLHRLGQTSPSPSVKAIAGFVLHGVRYLNPKLGDGLDLGDVVDGLRQATECSQAAGNLVVEAICMSLAIVPLTDRGMRTDATVLHAALVRIREIRFDQALTHVAAGVAVWLVRIGRAEAASVADGWLRAHVTNPNAALQPVLHQLDQLLDASSFPDARSRGAAIGHSELIDYLNAELTSVIDENTVDSS
jgi:hypothetical protein